MFLSHYLMMKNNAADFGDFRDFGAWAEGFEIPDPLPTKIAHVSVAKLLIK